MTADGRRTPPAHADAPTGTRPKLTFSTRHGHVYLRLFLERYLHRPQRTTHTIMDVSRISGRWALITPNRLFCHFEFPAREPTRLPKNLTSRTSWELEHHGKAGIRTRSNRHSRWSASASSATLIPVEDNLCDEISSFNRPEAPGTVQQHPRTQRCAAAPIGYRPSSRTRSST